MGKHITRYFQGNMVLEQGLFSDPITVATDFFMGIASRATVDHFSQYRLVEWIEEGRFPTTIVYDAVTHIGGDSYRTVKKGMTIFHETGFDGLCDIIRSEIDIQAYGAPAFEMKLSRRKSGDSKIEIRRDMHASRL